jgi:hypothetical protein
MCFNSPHDTPEGEEEIREQQKRFATVDITQFTILSPISETPLKTPRLLTIGCAAHKPSVYPVDNQLASRKRLNSEAIRPAAAMTSVASALDMNSPIAD